VSSTSSSLTPRTSLRVWSRPSATLMSGCK
jgi:hypothetical protein